MASDRDIHVEADQVTIAYGERVVQRDLCFTINRGDIFIIMGGSGCGKSSLLRVLAGLKAPQKGRVLIQGESLWEQDEELRQEILQDCGVSFQQGALWSSLTLAENLRLPLQEFTSYSASECDDLIEYKLSLVGLGGFGGYYPSEISGGMQKRAGMARALILDPSLLYIDEPSAGLDPISSRQLDDLIIQLSEGLGTTVVVVTHELASIFAIGTNSVFLDATEKTYIASGSPQALLDSCEHKTVQSFLRRGEAA